MPQIDLSRKYSNFIVPKNQIIVNNIDVMQNYCILCSKIVVEQTLGEITKFNFSIDDPQAKWSNSSLFELNNIVEIKMGYATVLETVVVGEITEVKTIFPSNRSPYIEIAGEKKVSNNTLLVGHNSEVYLLAYGNALLSFSASVKTSNKSNHVSTYNQEKTKNQNLSCSGVCIGLPDIKPGTNILLSRLGKKFNQNYIVEKVIHVWDGNLDFKTKFEARQ